MRLPPFVACLGAAAFCATLHASIVPTLHLEPSAVQAFERYVAQFERDVLTPWAESGKMWIDDAACCAQRKGVAAGKPVLEPRENTDIEGGSIHHFSGFMHLDGATIANVRQIMEDYPGYPKYFRPDVGQGSGTKNPDSTPQDDHFTSHLSLIQSTIWMAVSYDTAYDTHYRYVDPKRWESVSRSMSIREWRDPKDVSRGYYPEGEDHGFLWRTDTFWLVREKDNGIDLELDSMTLSRTVPTGFGWWGTKRTRDAVEKMLRDMKAAIESIR